jgi:tryptophan synthase alpha chain
VDGFIVVDMPMEEADNLAPYIDAVGLDLIRLVAPTTTDGRLPLVLEQAGGFIYYVAIAGITGTRSANADDLAAAIPRLRAHTTLPVAIGFGLRTPAQVAQAAQVADAAVVASVLIETLAKSLDSEGQATPNTAKLVLDQVRDLATAIRSARRPELSTA